MTKGRSCSCSKKGLRGFFDTGKKKIVAHTMRMTVRTMPIHPRILLFLDFEETLKIETFMVNPLVSFKSLDTSIIQSYVFLIKKYASNHTVVFKNLTSIKKDPSIRDLLR